MLGILAAIWAVVVRDIACIGKERRKGQILGWGAAGGDLGGVGVCWRRVFWIIAERWSGVLSWDPVGVEGVLGGLVLPCGVGHVGGVGFGVRGPRRLPLAHWWG